MSNQNYAKTGISCIWAALVLDGLSPVLALIRLNFDFGRLNIFGVIGFFVWWFLTAKVAAGRGWARIVYLLFTLLEILAVAGIAQMPGLTATVLGHGELGFLIAVIKLILQAAGVAILFATQGSGR
jgi:uncharacterized MnhB-related membrane protein